MSRLFASDGQKYWSFSFSISPSNEYSGLISLRIDWFDLLAVQGTLFSITTLPCSAFFMVELSHPYMTTGKTIALTIRVFVTGNKGKRHEKEEKTSETEIKIENTKNRMGETGIEGRVKDGGKEKVRREGKE